jgi:hypothetical protein
MTYAQIPPSHTAIEGATGEHVLRAIIGFLVGSMALEVFEAFLDAGQEHDDDKGPEGGPGSEGGVEDFWVFCPNPHEHRHDQKIHISKAAELKEESLGHEIEYVVPSRGDAVVAELPVRLVDARDAA